MIIPILCASGGSSFRESISDGPPTRLRGTFVSCGAAIELAGDSAHLGVSAGYWLITQLPTLYKQLSMPLRRHAGASNP